MAEWFLLRLSRDPERDATWMVADDAGRVVVPAQSGSLAQAAPLAAGRRLYVLIPGADVLVTDADVPVKSGAKLQQVVPYALEEQLAEDIESLHFAIGKRSGDSRRVPVAVVSRALLDRWLEALGSAGLSAEAVYADSELIPANPGQAVALLEDGDATLRVPGAAPATMPVDALGAALDGGGEASVNGLIIYTAPADWQRHARDVEPLRERFEGIKVQLLTGGALSLFAQQLPSATPINLLQGTYAPTNSLATGWRAWRVPTILAVCLLGLHILGKGVELGTLKQAERGIDASIDDAFRVAMPGEQNTVDAKRRMEQRLAALRGDGGALGLLPALGALAQARANVPGTTIGTLSYRDGALDLRMSAPSAESLDRLSQTLRAEGWQADLTSGNATDAGYEGRLQLRPRGTS